MLLKLQRASGALEEGRSNADFQPPLPPHPSIPDLLVFSGAWNLQFRQTGQCASDARSS